MESAPRTHSVLEQRSVLNMEPTLSNLNANSVAASRNGSAGEIHISVIHVTRNNVQEITCHVKRQANYHSALVLANVH